MSTNSKHDKPFRFLDSIRILLWITKSRYIDIICFINFIGSTMSNKYRLNKIKISILKKKSEIYFPTPSTISKGKHVESEYLITKFFASGILDKSTSTFAM